MGKFPQPSDGNGPNLAAPESARHRSDLAAGLRDRRLWIALVVALVVTWLHEGEVVPWRNEFFYLVRLFRTYQPTYIPVDWTLAGGAPEHFAFNHVFGLLAFALPPDALAWFGRLLTWTVNLGLLLLLARKLGVAPFLGLGALVVWIGWGQSLVAHSWVLGTFEAKCVSYAFLLGALFPLLDGRIRPAAFLVGLAFTFHPSVGLWGGVAVFAVIACELLGRFGDGRARWIEGAAAAGLVVLGAIPGLIATVPMVLSEHVATLSDWELMTQVKMPHHLDPETWPIRVLAILPVLLVFLGIHAWESKRPAWRRLFVFQLAIALPFLVGLILRKLSLYEELSYFPFRLFPLLTPLFFLFALLESLSRRTIGTAERAVAILAGLALLALPEPFSSYSHALQRRLAPSDDLPTGLAECYDWIGENLPADVEGIAPPGLDREFWYRAERGLVVCSEFQTYDRLSEWRRRVELLGGEMVRGPERRPSLTRHFEAITPDEMGRIVDDLEPDFLVTRAAYSWPIAFEAGEYKVYTMSTGH
ncbi:MAG: hypothetical protein R3E97_03955 [Candidatus Eisenbacteria bacterium]